MNRLWPALCALLLAWAVFSTWKWKSLSSAAPTASPLFANEAVADLERVVFLRQFADQSLNYDENSYWRNQTALAFLMGTSLREQRLQELAQQRERRKTMSFRQTSHLTSVKRNGDGYDLAGTLEGREADRSWHLGFTLNLRLGDVARTLENPWGLEVEAMTFTSSEEKTAGALALSLAPNSPALVAFPCVVENVETPANLPVRIKITSLRTSELQFVRQDEFSGGKTVTALCHDRKFPIELTASAAGGDLFADVGASQGLARAEKSKTPKKAKEAYQKTLEQELGFVVEE